MLEQIREISASGWFCHKEICYDAARSHERNILRLPIPCLLDLYVRLLHQSNSHRQVHISIKTLLPHISVKMYSVLILKV